MIVLPVTGYLLIGAVPLGVERAFLQRDVSWLCLQLLIVCRVDCDRIALCLRESEVGRSLSALYCHVQGLHGLQLVHQLVHQALRSCPTQITDNSLCLITKKSTITSNKVNEECLSKTNIEDIKETHTYKRQEFRSSHVCKNDQVMDDHSEVVHPAHDQGRPKFLDLSVVVISKLTSKILTL